MLVPREGEPTLVVPKGEDPLVQRLDSEKLETYVSFSMEEEVDSTRNLVFALKRASPKKHKSIGLETADVSGDTKGVMARAFNSKRIVGISQAMTNMRVCKDEEEIAKIRDAVKVAEEGVMTMLDEGVEGMTEVEILSRVKSRMELMAGRPLEVYADLISGEKCLGVGSPVEVASIRRLASGDDIIADVLPKVDGYWADLTRTKHLGVRSSKRVELYAAVGEAQRAATDKVAPGVPACDIDAEARRVLKEHGYSKEFPHYTGHGFGLDFREAPILVEWNRSRLKPGMVITIEPGVYSKSAGCVRLEDDVLVTESGHEVLSNLPYE